MKGFSDLKYQLATSSDFYKQVGRELAEEDDSALKQMAEVFQDLADRLNNLHAIVQLLEDMCHTDITHARKQVARLGGYIEDVTRPWS